MSQDSSVYVDPGIAASGISELKSAADPLRTSWNNIMGLINSAHAANPWGEDGEGEQFKTGYLTEAKAGTFKEDAAAIMDPVLKLPENVETAIKTTYAADAVAGRRMDEVDVTADATGGGGGGGGAGGGSAASSTGSSAVGSGLSSGSGGNGGRSAGMQSARTATGTSGVGTGSYIDEDATTVGSSGAGAMTSSWLAAGSNADSAGRGGTFQSLRNQFNDVTTQAPAGAVTAGANRAPSHTGSHGPAVQVTGDTGAPPLTDQSSASPGTDSSATEQAGGSITQQPPTSTGETGAGIPDSSSTAGPTSPGAAGTDTGTSQSTGAPSGPAATPGATEPGSTDTMGAPSGPPEATAATVSPASGGADDALAAPPPGGGVAASPAGGGAAPEPGAATTLGGGPPPGDGTPASPSGGTAPAPTAGVSAGGDSPPPSGSAADPAGGAAGGSATGGPPPSGTPAAPGSGAGVGPADSAPTSPAGGSGSPMSAAAHEGAPVQTGSGSFLAGGDGAGTGAPTAPGAPMAPGGGGAPAAGPRNTAAAATTAAAASNAAAAGAARAGRAEDDEKGRDDTDSEAATALEQEAEELAGATGGAEPGGRAIEVVPSGKITPETLQLLATTPPPGLLSLSWQTDQLDSSASSMPADAPALSGVVRAPRVG